MKDKKKYLKRQVESLKHRTRGCEEELAAAHAVLDAQGIQKYSGEYSGATVSALPPRIPLKDRVDMLLKSAEKK